MNNTITFEDVKTYIMSKASSEELTEMIDYYKVRRKSLGVVKGLQFNYGDRVWFDAKSKGIIKGKFIKQMSKNSEVISDAGTKWRVAPSLLHADISAV